MYKIYTCIILTALPNDSINWIMFFRSHPTADMIRSLIIHAAWASYIYRNQGVRCLISDEISNVNSNAYEMYALPTCILHKHQVKYVSKVKSLDTMFNHFNTNLITETLARALTLKYAHDAYDTESDVYDDFYNRMHYIMAIHEH